MKVGEDDGAGSLGMPVIAEDLKTILSFYGVFVVPVVTLYGPFSGSRIILYCWTTESNRSARPLNGAESVKVRTLTSSNMS